MKYFINSGAYGTTDLAIVNRDCKYKKVHSLADILQCEGKTVGPEMLLLQQTNTVSTRQFSIEKLTKKDKVLRR